MTKKGGWTLGKRWKHLSGGTYYISNFLSVEDDICSSIRSISFLKFRYSLSIITSWKRTIAINVQVRQTRIHIVSVQQGAAPAPGTEHLPEEGSKLSPTISLHMGVRIRPSEKSQAHHSPRDSWAGLLFPGLGWGQANTSAPLGLSIDQEPWLRDRAAWQGCGSTKDQVPVSWLKATPMGRGSVLTAASPWGA